jgi:hypothetical protein
LAGLPEVGGPDSAALKSAGRMCVRPRRAACAHSQQLYHKSEMPLALGCLGRTRRGTAATLDLSTVSRRELVLMLINAQNLRPMLEEAL